MSLPVFSRARAGVLLAWLLVLLPALAARGETVDKATATADSPAELFAQMAEGLGLGAAQLNEVRRIFARSARLGQGNAAVTRHPMSPAECRQRRADAGLASPPDSGPFAAICGAPHMAPLYDPARQAATAAEACIDQYEFPGLPCVYPVVWVQASEAAALCGAVGKRLCDAHEWEGACAGSLRPPDYAFNLVRGLPAGAAVARLRAAVNQVEDTAKVWSYGKTYRRGICATGALKTAGCSGGDFAGCGSNTYPAGAFPDCRSPLGVFDLHGNAAEHMNLPLAADQMASRGSSTLGVTEMKGSWFIWDLYRAHQDACRWRAPFWHGSRVLDPRSHRNYHLGFRCCKSLPPAGAPAASPPDSAPPPSGGGHW